MGSVYHNFLPATGCLTDRNRPGGWNERKFEFRTPTGRSYTGSLLTGIRDVMDTDATLVCKGTCLKNRKCHCSDGAHVSLISSTVKRMDALRKINLLGAFLLQVSLASCLGFNNESV